jgi:nucleoside-diphosphate-sugar epimerase
MYLVTGGAGFIGSNIVRRLVAKGEQVRVLDDFSTGKRENLAGLSGIEIIEGSLLDGELVRKAVEGVQYVLHQGAISSVPRSLVEPELVNAVNSGGTVKLLEALKGKPLKKFVFAASSAVYGNNEALPVAETAPVEPLSPYAVSKYAAELYCKTFADNFNLPTVSLRYFNVFGPYQDPASEYAAVIPIFILKMLRGEKPVIYGDGEQTRDFVYIDDVVEANLQACISDRVGRGEVINVAAGRRFSLNELVKTLNEIMGQDFEPVYSEPRPGDVRHSQATIEGAKKLLDYRVRVDFKEGLRRTIEWFKDGRAGNG